MPEPCSPLLLHRPTSSHLSPQSWAFTLFLGSSRTGSRRNQVKFESLHFVAVKEVKGKGFRDFCWGFGGEFLRRCKKSWELEGDFGLEAEILEFMKNSENPEKFPSKKELIDAGRIDLVESILKQGGWLAFGWEYDVGEIDLEFPGNKEELDNGMVLPRSLEKNEEWSSEVSCFRFDSNPLASTSGRPLDTAADDDSGIEGILSRLEKERNMKFGFDTDSIKLDWPAKTLKNAVSGALGDQILETNEGSGAVTENGYHEVIEYNQIRTQLQHLKSELSSVLQTMKTNIGKSVSENGHEGSSDDLLKLSDAWEFQENEIMNAQDKLQSIRAKFATLEGKMALAIIDAEKIVKDKQKRIDDAHRALQLLSTACLIWPNPASEVLLAGSFDGWATQRKMERSRTGIFSLYLKLYPGRYEIKFIVDGEWKIDPLRPVVHNNGYENNLLVVT